MALHRTIILLASLLTLLLSVSTISARAAEPHPAPGLRMQALQRRHVPCVAVDDATLIESGLYGWVRHPIYCGLILAAFGWGLLVQGWLTLLWAAVLLIFFDIKSRREEAWLLARFPAYADYRRRVRKLIPFIY